MDEHGWTCEDAASTEVEMAEVLTAMVRMIKPHVIVETGCYRGHATRALAIGCLRNERGHVHSCDVLEPRVAQARTRCAGLPASVYLCKGVDLSWLREADLVFLDSDYACRAQELALCRPGAVVIVHDTRISFDSSIPPLEGLVRAAGGICFDSHRGWGMLRK